MAEASSRLHRGALVIYVYVLPPTSIGQCATAQIVAVGVEKIKGPHAQSFIVHVTKVEGSKIGEAALVTPSNFGVYDAGIYELRDGRARAAARDLNLWAQ